MMTGERTIEQVDEIIHHNLLALRPHTAPHYSLSHKFSWPVMQGDVRVKFEYGEEKSIMIIARPITMEMLRECVAKRFRMSLNLYCYNWETKLLHPLLSQGDLDHCVALHDARMDSTSFRIVLSHDSLIVNDITSSPTPDNLREQVAKFTQRSYSAQYPSEEGFRESPEYYNTYHGPYNNRSTDSPPPGFIDDSTSTSSHYMTSHDEGKFIPETDGFSEQDTTRSIPSTPSDLSINEMLSRHEYYDDDAIYHPEVLTRTYPRERSISDSQSQKSLYGTYPLNPNNKLLNQHKLTGYTNRLTDSELPIHSLATLTVTHKRSVPVKWSKGKLLGTGAFGQVFVCTDHDNPGQQDLAVKVVDIEHIERNKVPAHNDSVNMKKEVRSFESEVQLLKNLHHERIVTYFGTERKDGKLYIFMEYMPGGSIYQLVKDVGPLGMPLVRKYTRQILEGVAYLHEMKIVHRDIKGANILCDNNGNIKLADFGASKRLQTIRSGVGFKSVHGTPYWMAPEVIKGDDPYTFQADIWSVGATVVEMITGHPPWHEYEPTAAMFKIVMSDTKPELPGYSSEECKDFIQLCFIKDKSERATALTLLDHPFCCNVF